MFGRLMKNIAIPSLFISVLLLNIAPLPTAAQRTSLDNAFGQLYRPFRLLALNIIGRSSEDPQNRQLIRSLDKEQKIHNKRTRSLDSFCDTNGPGRRSDTVPTSVHRLRPGDIDVIGAMGDSLTAGNGIYGTNLLQVTVENRGMVWSIGGQGTWREYLTLPNILKEFNPNLYGYSLRDGLSTDRSSKFNVAELGAMSRDIPYEAKILVKRMQRDPLVNMTEHWKMVTLLIGNNDFCTDMCYYQNPQVVIKQHERNMLKAYRYLRDTVPRLILNIVPPPNLRLLTKLSGLPQHCYTTLRFECPCLFGKSKSHLDYYEKIMKDWIAKDKEIVERAEFNTDSFTINLQPFTLIDDFPRTATNNSDIRMFSADCFHLSQLSNAACSNVLWNNLFETDEQKSHFNANIMETFRCPTEEHPYIVTRVNRRADFKV